MTSEPFAGFHLLPVRLHEHSAHLTRLYIKRHQSKAAAEGGDGDSAKQALFVAGLPLALDAARLQTLLASFGPVATVQVHPKKTSAVILFANPSSCKKALAAAKSGALVELPASCWPDRALAPHGLRARVEQHKLQYPGNNELQKQLGDWMAQFEADEERKKREAEAAAAADEGWTLVTKRAGRKRKAGNTVSGGISQAAAAEVAARKKPRELQDFYRSQARERKKGEMVALRTKFAEAQQRLKDMRAARKFQPD